MHIALCVVFSAAAVAQSWTFVPTAAHPGDRRDAAAAYDIGSGRTVLFGRDVDVGGNFPNDTWLYDGTNWSQPTPAVSPPGRRRHAMSYDAVRGRVVMFGGSGAAGVLDDTWEWDGSNWLATTPAVRPAGRFAHSMAFDLLRGVAVVFGGTTSEILPRTRTDTWEWNGTNWSQVITAAAPSEGEDTAMCYDIGRGVCVLAGGTSFFGAPDQSTWEYNGITWVNRTSVVGPGPTATPGLGVMDAQMVYDPSRQRSILFGGRTPNGTFPTDTWEYDGSQWTLVSGTGPSSRTRFVMTMDLARNKVVLYGGVNGAFTVHFHDTWEWSGGVAATYSTFAPGCASGLGVPTNTASSLARLGQTLVVNIGNVPAPEVALLYLGVSNTTSVFGPLPIDLGFLGAPGCFARVSTDIELLGIGGGGTIAFSQPIPNSPVFLALPFYTQAFALAVGANPFGVVVSNAAQGIIGS